MKTGIPSEKGILGYYNLLEWWNIAFTEEEQHFIKERYKPMGGGEFTSGVVTSRSATVVNFLTGLQTWFTTLKDESISEKILIKAESLITTDSPILDAHFLYNSLIRHCYKKRNVAVDYYEHAKYYCKRQIDISLEAKRAFQVDYPTSKLPGHRGFEQLAIIFQKECEYEKAIKLCLVALSAGWDSDWEKRILNIQKKIR